MHMGTEGDTQLACAVQIHLPHFFHALYLHRLQMLAMAEWRANSNNVLCRVL